MNNPFLACVHTHTCYCDGKDTPEALVDAALSLGFETLGFSGHGMAAYDDAAMLPEAEAAYRTEGRRLQEAYRSRLELLLGVEHDALSPYPDYAYDYLIESVHWLRQGGQWYSVDYSPAHTEDAIRRGFGGDPYAYCRAYFETCAAAYEKSPAQIAGHLDLVSKFNQRSPMFEETDPRYLSPALDALECAVARGMAVELNTGAISRGYRTLPYPAVPLLRRLRELGGQVIVTSDCHDAQNLACWYPEAAELLRACGFRHTVSLHRNGFREEGL